MVQLSNTSGGDRGGLGTGSRPAEIRGSLSLGRSGAFPRPGLFNAQSGRFVSRPSPLWDDFKQPARASGTAMCSCLDPGPPACLLRGLRTGSSFKAACLLLCVFMKSQMCLFII